MPSARQLPLIRPKAPRWSSRWKCEPDAFDMMGDGRSAFGTDRGPFIQEMFQAQYAVVKPMAFRDQLFEALRHPAITIGEYRILRREIRAVPMRVCFGGGDFSCSDCAPHKE